MLYKKYHKDFIRKFKKGSRFNSIIGYKFYNISSYIVVKEPYYSTYYLHIELQSNTCIPSWTLIYPSGRINLDIKAIEDVV